MPLESPKNWWEPFHFDEKLWLGISIAWGVVMFFMMPLGHLNKEAKQNVSSETYKTTPAEFKKYYDAFVTTYQRKDAEGKRMSIKNIPIVDAPSAEQGESYMVARAWQFEPVLVFKKGKTYRVHLSSLDFQHGFSLQPQNFNYQVLPNYDYVLTFVPNETGTFHVVCNEYCFYAGPTNGHDTMVGRIIVEE